MENDEKQFPFSRYAKISPTSFLLANYLYHSSLHPQYKSFNCK